MYSFILRHRNMTVVGDQPMDFTRQFLFKDTVYEMRMPSRGYLYVLDPPLPVNVLEGEIKGDAEEADRRLRPDAVGASTRRAAGAGGARFGGGQGRRRRRRRGVRGRGRLMAQRARFWRDGGWSRWWRRCGVRWRGCWARPRRRDGRAGGGARSSRRGGARAGRAARRERAHRVHGAAVDEEGDGEWGKKRLGVIGPRQPLIVQRPRDSGPLDVIVRAEGCLPVQTRAYTFADSKVAVKVTPLDQKNTLLGYREELPARRRRAAVAAGPDGGVR